MDINLTGQILLPFLVVVVGGIITYYITVTIEERKSRRALKVQVYFELIDVIVQAKRVFEDNRLNPVSEVPGKDKEIKDKDMGVASAFLVAKLKAYVGGSEEFNKLIDSKLPPNVLKDSDIETYQRSVKLLIDQMKKELTQPTFMERILKKGRAKHWWQFWRRG